MRLRAVFTLLLPLLLFECAQASGQIKFRLLEFSTDGTLENGKCCSKDRTGEGCVCEVYVHVCVGFQKMEYYSEQCSITYHKSSTIALNRLVSTYNASLPFTSRWSTPDISLTVEIRQVVTKAVIIRSVKSIRLSPLSKEILRFSEVEPNKTLAYSVGIECDPNFYGAECFQYCNENIASLHHRCSPEGKKVCKEGWSGERCDKPVCSGGCGENGSCVSPGNCSCNIGYRGPQCRECVVRKGCQHGYCNKAFDCICHKNWGGLNCDRDLDYCYHNSPCNNGGKCSSGGLQDYYYCNCTIGYGGKNCEFKINPCLSGVCGEFGECVLRNRSTYDYFCRCDGKHYGKRCEHLIDPFDEVQYPERGVSQVALPSSCRLSARDFVLSGISWNTANCQLCKCEMGVLQCIKMDCKSGCLCSQNKNVCSKEETCLRSTNEQCMKQPCQTSCGRCVLSSQRNREIDMHFCRQMALEGKKNLKLCTALFLELDLDTLFAGTSTEDVCHHLVREVELFNSQKYKATMDCSKFEETIVQVDLAALGNHVDASSIKEFLKTRLRAPLSTSAIVRSIRGIAERDDANVLVWDRNLPRAFSGIADKNWESQKLISTNHILALIIFLLVLIVMIIVSVCLFKYSGWTAVKQRCFQSGDLKQASPCIYYTQPIMYQPKLRRHSAVPNEYNEKPFLELSDAQRRVSVLMDSDIGCKEVEDNERNARLLRKYKDFPPSDLHADVEEQLAHLKLRESLYATFTSSSLVAPRDNRLSQQVFECKTITV